MTSRSPTWLDISLKRNLMLNPPNNSPPQSMSSAPLSNLPSSDSPSLALHHPSPEEKPGIWKLNGSSWRGRLSLEAYLRREEHLSSQPFTGDGGLTFWILADTASAPNSRTILASCESYRKRALVRRQGGQVQDVTSHGIGSVFCNPDFRGRGYAARMLRELGTTLETWQQKNGQSTGFSILYSDIGKVYEKLCQVGRKGADGQV